jgi:hydrogenase nickel incorporation protein HypA/HybF
MHELAITENILDITIRHAEQAGATRVTNLHLVIGQLASIVDDSVQFYWDIISTGTIAEKAQLHFRRIPTELLCLKCNSRYFPTDIDMACPKCNSLQIKVVAGEEFFLESIDID